MTCLWLYSIDCVVQLGATFTQKCQAGKYKDPHIEHPFSQFLSIDKISQMECEIQDARSYPMVTKSARNEQAKQMMPNNVNSLLNDDVLDECEKSFIAAQETVTKASSKFYASTGLMAMLCRHDRVLWLANITTPGERQHYAFALLKRLFQELPVDWHIGILYDIACQIHRSTIKVL